MSNNGWIGFDLDGTLAVYETFKGPGVIGEPIPEMIEKIKEYLNNGFTCKIFTARVWSDGSFERNREAREAREAIRVWCQNHIGQVLEITCVKDYSMWALYDDRAIQVQKNTGRILGRPSFILTTESDP